MGAWTGFEVDVLDAIGAPHSVGNLEVLSVWHACEASAATNNPFNTTLACCGGVSINSAGVKSYPSPAAGTDATRRTLEGGYSGIVGDLRAGNLSAGEILTNNLQEFSKWGTNLACLSGAISTSPPTGAPPGVQGPRTGTGERTAGERDNVGYAAGGPAGEAAQLKHLTRAFHAFTLSIATTIPTRARRARVLMRNFQNDVALRRRHHG